jgi:hypothetical protein
MEQAFVVNRLPIKFNDVLEAHAGNDRLNGELRRSIVPFGERERLDRNLVVSATQ